MRRIMGLLIAGSILFFCDPGGSRAGPVIFTGSGTQNGFLNQAKVEFDLSGTDLTVTLTNTSPQLFNKNTGGTDMLQATNVLSGVLFDIAGNPTLTVGNAKLASGSSMLNTGSATDTSASGWGFGTPSGGSFNGQAYGIEAFGGISVPMGKGNFANSNTAPNSAVKLDGIDYGVVGSGYVAGTGNDHLPTTPFEQTAEVFHFTVPSGFDLSNINNVSFQYGTSNGEAAFVGTPPPQQPTPEPGALTLLGIGIAGLGGCAWRRRRKPSPAA
jgi:hypothetical protein